MKLKIHRKEQWDLECWPLLCIHAQTKTLNARLFCVWLWGVECSWTNIRMVLRDLRAQKAGVAV